MTKQLEDRISDLDSVLVLVRAELIAAWKKHPTPFHNAHEGHAVIREEFETELWEHVCKDTAYTRAGMREAIQSAAMCVRFVVDLHDHPKSNSATAFDLGAETMAASQSMYPPPPPLRQRLAAMGG